MKLAHLSDIHYDGRSQRLELLERAMQAAEDRSADHLLLAGDLVDFADPRHLAALADVIRGSRWWDPGRLTILPGNHDLYRHSFPNFFRCVLGGFPGLRATTEVFEGLFAEFMGAPVAQGATLPSLKALDSEWHMLLLDTLVKTHRFDFLGSWRGWLDPALTERTLAALAEVAPKHLVVTGHHFLMPASAARTARARGLSFFDDNFPEVVKLLDGLRPRPRIYLCGHVHAWGEGVAEAFDTESVARVPVYCQGRTGGVDGIDPSWTLHVLSADGGIDSQLVPLGSRRTRAEGLSAS